MGSSSSTLNDLALIDEIDFPDHVDQLGRAADCLQNLGEIGEPVEATDDNPWGDGCPLGARGPRTVVDAGVSNGLDVAPHAARAVGETRIARNANLDRRWLWGIELDSLDQVDRPFGCLPVDRYDAVPLHVNRERYVLDLGCSETSSSRKNELK